jgi:uncharacterized protein (TIGR02646 family)
MIRINKFPCPPQLLDYAASEPLNIEKPFADCKINAIVRSSLLKEQKYLCAYCMTPIDFNHSVIEHILPKSLNPDKARTYGNLLATCDNENLHCDKSKKENSLLQAQDLIFNSIEECLIYNNEGLIIAKDPFPLLDEDINRKGLLNLNQAKYLMRNRKEVINQVESQIKQMMNKGYSSQKIKNKLAKVILDESQREKLTPYSGVLRFKCQEYIDI